MNKKKILNYEKENQINEEMRFSKSDTINLWSDSAVQKKGKKEKKKESALRKISELLPHCWPWIDHWSMNVHGRELCYVYKYISLIYSTTIYKQKSEWNRKKTFMKQGWVWYQGTTESSF